MNRSSYIAVPFKSDGSEGIYEFNGIAKFSAAGLVIEFESKLLGLFGSEIREVRLSLNDIVDVRFKKGIWRFFSRIHVRVNTVSKINGLPNKGGRFIMKVKREDWELGHDAVEFMKAQMRPETLAAGDPVESIGSGGSPVERMIGEGKDKYQTNDLNKTQKLDK